MADCCWFLQAEETLADELSKLVRFQAFCGVATAAEALARIHHEAVERNEAGEMIMPAVLRNQRPFAMIWSEQPSLRRVADHNSLDFRGQTGLMLQITNEQILAREPTALTAPLMIRWLKDQCGRMLVELFDAWSGLQQSLNLDFALSQPLKGHDDDFAVFECQFLYGLEDA